MLLLFFLFYFSASPGIDFQAKDALTGTKWTVAIAEGCTDTLWFKAGNRVSDYSCEAGEWYKGGYTMNKDTVVETCVNQSEDGGGEERWRVTFVYRGDALRAIRSQGFSHGKWDRSEPMTTVFFRLIEN